METPLLSSPRLTTSDGRHRGLCHSPSPAALSADAAVGTLLATPLPHFLPLRHCIRTPRVRLFPKDRLGSPAPSAPLPTPPPPGVEDRLRPPRPRRRTTPAPSSSRHDATPTSPTECAADGGDISSRCPPPPHLPRGRVLSIQSHVVSGTVGQRATVLPLQVLGFDVDAVNSVQFSNHTGYPAGFRGEVLSGAALANLTDGLAVNGLLGGVTHLLTGYIGSASFLRGVVDTRRRLAAASPGLIYVCDPVLGDGGRLYVPEELVAIYREEVLPLAAVATPNAFELGLLAGVAGGISDEASAFAAASVLHDSTGVDTIVVTSLNPPPPLPLLPAGAAPPGDGDGPGDTGDGGVGVVTMLVSAAGGRHRWAVDAPRLPGAYTGAGDMAAALVLAWAAIAADAGDAAPLRTAAARAMATVAAVLRRTCDRAAAARRPPPELALVASLGEVVCPPEGLVTVREVPGREA
ncbi:hypothetical protein BU14_0130s0006 [Porphyra umbilicalis]|uniref:pyridoxal kinase n=1 Tax=Porphyra umbilicalis TaxID=2786 RepID=A0A1X6PAR7_PORUM|nr:hypothetical protein BU14_0130s0006 [Porphyra umbilicalis]|eukprot:OSX77850.1 hypothetical protein BU14_0130s0006 [Porphyra umbilicalis]